MTQLPREELRVSKENVICSFTSKNRPCLSAKPGQGLVFETMDCFSGEIRSSDDKFEKVGWDKINPATGPVFIEGAEAGDILCVDILDIQVKSPGVMISVPNMGAVGQFFSESQSHIIPITNGLARMPGDYIFEIDPMIGVIGVAPKEGAVPCGTPGIHGGNLDTNVIGADSTVYLPVQVPGALLAMGDLHALMGDGEILICGIEAAGEVKVRTRLLKGTKLPFPLVETEKSFYALWSHESLDQAAAQLLDKAIRWISEASGVSPLEASLILTVKGNLQVSQVVDPLKTCRLEIPKVLLKGSPFCRQL